MLSQPTERCACSSVLSLSESTSLLTLSITGNMEEQKAIEKCFVCKETAQKRCADCSDIHYCSEIHERLHRRGEPSEAGETCWPFRIAEKEGVGRYIVTTRDIKAGEIIFEEGQALATGPSQASSPQCLICRKSVVSGSVCSECRFPMCSTCSPAHSKLTECPILARMVKKRGLQEACSDLYEAIVPLRLLMLTGPDASLVDTFMDHEQERRNDEQHWQRTLMDVIEPLCSSTGRSQRDVSHAVGVAEVNNVEIRSGPCGVRAVYPLTSLLSHSCVPNARSIVGATFAGVIASVDVAQNQELSITYVPLHICSLLRRPQLKDNWYFDCRCRRCVDPTELGTFLDAIRCRKCPSGHLLPRELTWVCDRCPSTRSKESVQQLIGSLLDEKDSLDRSDLAAYLSFSNKAGRHLHQNHYILNACRRWILPLYCRVPANSEITNDMLKRKIDMSERYLYVLDRVEAGLTKNRGRTLYELADTRIALQNRLYHAGDVTKEALIKEALISREAAASASRCLKYDEPSSFEGYLYRAANSLVASLDKMLDLEDGLTLA